MLGPRNYIAFRMGGLVAKVALALVLSRFNLEATEFKEIDRKNMDLILGFVIESKSYL